MRKRETFFLTFFLFLFLSVFVFVLGRTNILSETESLLASLGRPLQNVVSSVFSFPKTFFENADLQELQEENTSLRKKLIDQEAIQRENSALKDQFQTSFPKSTTLMPSQIIGSTEYLVIDKGKKDGVSIGLAVVVKDVVVGKITKVAPHLSVVTKVTDTSSSFTALVSPSLALGIVKGEGDSEMELQNVLLSEQIAIGDTVVTKGNVDKDGIGYPANLIVGKITSIDKKPSSLFQTAKIKSSLDFSRLATVFIVMANK